MEQASFSPPGSVSPPQPKLPAPKDQAPPAPDETNRRLHPRYRCEGTASIFVPHGGLRFEGHIADLSLSGCFIESAGVNLERGTYVEVSFNTRQIEFRLAGTIAVLRRNCGAGVAFQNVSERAARRISELVAELGGPSGG